MVEAVKTFLIAKVVPVAAAAVATWLFATTHVFNLFGVTEGDVSAVTVQALTFVVTYVGSWLTTHKILGLAGRV